MVGEPVAYATGSPELKAIGPSRTVFYLPDRQESEWDRLRGRTADTPSFAEEALGPSPELGLKDLEERTRKAHRDYLAALRYWEDVRRLASCTRNVCADDPLNERQIRCNDAEARKERRRVAFRNLYDELGYLPARSKAVVRAEDATDGPPACA